MNPLDTQGIDFVGGAKALVPQDLRPASVKEIWAEPLLSTREFFRVLGTMAIFLSFGVFLYYSFYIAFIVTSVESFQRTTRAPARPRLAGSYRRITLHMLHTIGLKHFITGAWTFLWTAVLAFVGRTAMPVSTDNAIIQSLGGPSIISGLLLEPLNILFTHKILTASSFSPFDTLIRLLPAMDFYVNLAYIVGIRIAFHILQTRLLVSDRSQHYANPFLTFSTFIVLFLFRIAMVTNTHARLLAPEVTTTIHVQRLGGFQVGRQLWHLVLRMIYMIKLLTVCSILAILHFVSFMAALVYASGHGDKIMKILTASGQKMASDGPLRMLQDPELDHDHRH
ncbi:hypothetical protein PIIN_05184 [Serendipita indica DSM 11827]|uniref:Uncharacterized protein n=1 Tax=Serendipita indica (strain DSM 11827) TaxID=1109443 RepID=G4TIU6_SERID|nr:hypothetical protein PIIN_05184 [Serendipita indica DSM 11827]